MPVPTFRLDGPDDGPLVVLSHSLGTDMDLFDPQVRELAKWFRVVRYEHPGHGGSHRSGPVPTSLAGLGEELGELLDHLGAPSAALVGVSLGAMVALWFAAHHPERVSGLVVASAAPALPPAAAWTERAAQVRAGGTEILLEAALERWFAPGYVGEHPEVRPRVAAMLARTDPEGYACCCEAIAGADLSGAIRTITAPSLVLIGAQDPVTTPGRGLETAAAIPGASLLVVPRAGHLVTLERPAVVNAAIVDHLLGPGAARGDRTRRAVLGDAHVEAAGARGAIRAPFVDYITTAAWGDVWARPGLDRATRSAVTLAALTATGAFDELAMHVRAALRHGLSAEQIGEILLHTAVYAGAPKANRATTIAQGVLDEQGPGPSA